MPLALRSISQPANQNLTIIARNHRDATVFFCYPPCTLLTLDGGWLGDGSRSTEVNITNIWGRTSHIFLQDDGRWGLIISGNIDGRERRIPVNGSKDFDMYIESDGSLRLECRGGVFNPTDGRVVRIGADLTNPPTRKT